ncbi:MAG: GPR endopeptidase [Lachnospiraceae bacterium]|nr:GPR endopeptidase [Lachnospiraceae bacterium]
MGSFMIRTDLALEARESVEEGAGALRGVSVEEYCKKQSEIKVTKVTIENKNSAKTLGKPVGTYITIEAPALSFPDAEYHAEISDELAIWLKRLLPENKEDLSVLVVGLGNRDVTADALGPRVVDNLVITRHILLEFGKAAYQEKENVPMISGLIPGVMAKTGMESAEIIKGVAEKTKPDVVFVVDALAARSTKRLNRTIQITDTGIHPGSGVGNHRNAVTKESLGIPVIAIGVPTVVDAATIVTDALGKLLGNASRELVELREQLQMQSGEFYNMYVTGKDVDYEVKQISHMICDAIHKALEV